jgi:uncharacterized protein
MRPSVAEELDLQRHPEGGWYRRTWESAERVHTRDGRDRPTATMILFHLPAGEASAWHRVRSDEIWFAHRGVVTLELGGTGATPVPGGTRTVGVDTTAGEQLQVVVPAGVWQRTLPTGEDALVSCVVSPGFDFEDFELAPE